MVPQLVQAIATDCKPELSSSSLDEVSGDLTVEFDCLCLNVEEITLLLNAGQPLQA